MAELKKMQDYEYDLPELVDQPEQQMPDSSSNQEIILPQSPAKRLKQISALEKIAVASVAIAIVALCVLTVMLRTNISGAEKEITSIQTEINDKKQEKTSLEQEKNELSRTERIKQ
ncbi:cell division protein FtsL, partial [Enterococcus faecium]|nr:cell division protein FtsL [Enterococcus faecium]